VGSIHALVMLAPRLGLACGALAAVAVVADAGAKEAVALSGIGGAFLGALLAAAVVAFGRAPERSAGQGIEVVGRLLALVAALLAAVLGLESIARAEQPSPMSIVAPVALGWLLLAEVAAPALRVWVAGGPAARRRVPLVLACVAPLLGLFLMYRDTLKLQVAEPRDSASLLAAAAASNTPLRVALIGLDGADWELLDLASARGLTPQLDRMRAAGTWGPLRAEDPFSPPSWTTIATGLSKSEHGVDDFVQRAYSDGTLLPVAPDTWPFVASRSLLRAELACAALEGRSARVCSIPGRWLGNFVAPPILNAIAPRVGESYRLIPTGALSVRAPRIWEIAAQAGRPSVALRWLFTLPADGSPAAVLSGWQEGWRTPVGSNDPDLLALARAMAARAEPPATASEDEVEHYLATAEAEIEVGRGLADEILARDPSVNFYSHVFYFPDGLGHRLADSIAAIAGTNSAPTPDAVARLLALIGRVDRFIAELHARGFAPVVVSDHGIEPLPEHLPVPVVSQVLTIRWERLFDDLGLSDAAGHWFQADSPKGAVLQCRDDAPAAAPQAASDKLTSLALRDGRPLFRSCRVDAAAKRLELFGPVELTLAELDTAQVRGFGGRARSLRHYVIDRGIRGLHGRPLPALRRELGQEGVFAALAPGLRTGHVRGVSTRDIAPLILHLLDLPLEPAHRVEGLEILLRADGMQRRPIRRRRQPSPLPQLAGGETDDAERRSLEAIRALGYLN